MRELGLLKGVCHEIFYIFFIFRLDIEIFKKLRGVHPTIESTSAVCITLWSQTAHRGVRIYELDEYLNEYLSKSKLNSKILDGFES